MPAYPDSAFYFPSIEERGGEVDMGTYVFFSSQINVEDILLDGREQIKANYASKWFLRQISASTLDSIIISGHFSPTQNWNI